MSKYLLGIEDTETILREYGFSDEQIEGWKEQYDQPQPEQGIYIPDEYLSNRDRALAKNNGLCVYCGNPANSVDHVIPRSKGGGHNLDNLVPACMDCNRRKKDKLDWKPAVRT